MARRQQEEARAEAERKEAEEAEWGRQDTANLAANLDSSVRRANTVGHGPPKKATELIVGGSTEPEPSEEEIERLVEQVERRSASARLSGQSMPIKQGPPKKAARATVREPIELVPSSVGARVKRKQVSDGEPPPAKRAESERK